MNNPVAFVLLEGPVTLNETALLEALRQRHPDVRWNVTEHGANVRADGPLVIRADDHLLVAMSMPAPIPLDENLWKRASSFWPEAPGVASRHRAHLVVSTMGAAEDGADIRRLTYIENTRLTTAMVGGLIATTPGCCAAVWGGKVASSAQMWLEGSRRAFAPFPGYPFTLWLDVIPYKSDRTVGAITIGLSAFVDREIEFEVDGMDLPTTIHRVAGLATYLIEHGTAVKDGDTIGVSATDRIKIHHRISRLTGLPVIAVGDIRLAPEQPRHYPIIPAAIAKDHPLLVMLSRVGLFDASSPDNQVQLPRNARVSDVRLESYDHGLNGVFSGILGTDAYVEADEKARRALMRGETELAKSALMPFAMEIRKFQETARYAIGRGDLHMF
ncbi:DUF4261 domain-containing protein [Bradyrhizobium sp. B124]|uniref:DUF4261 domain-containing protein n=1 Tax=Bradyrhizobium sp. B124 TaxID=3140245 RepID=UPI00318338E9